MAASNSQSTDAQVFMLYLASSSGDVAKVSELSGQLGVKVDTKDGSGRTSLDLARQHNDQIAMRTLMTFADQQRANTEGRYCGDLAHPSQTDAQHDQCSPSDHTHDRDSMRVVQIYEAARFGDPELLKLALKILDADVNHTSAGGDNALRMSAMNSDHDALRCLLSAGASIDGEVVELVRCSGDLFCLNLLEVCFVADEQ